MIGHLQGILVEKRPPHLIIDVNGVGYEVQSSMNTIFRLPDEQERVHLYTHLVIREDDHSLYAFYDIDERNLFRHLLKVNGVGPKVALAILSGIDGTAFVSCVLNNDIASLTRVPGIGKKTAERLIIEMRDRLADWRPTNLTAGVDNPSSACDNLNGAMTEAVSALIALGYKPHEATRAIKQIAQPDMDCEALIRAALQGISA